MRDVLGWSRGGDGDAARDERRLGQQRAPARAGDARRAPAARESAARPAGAELDAAEQELLRGFIDAHERADAEAAVALMREDIRVTMPPHPMVFEGIKAVLPLHRPGLRRPGDWRLVPTRANRMPTAACYLRAHGDDTFRAFKFDVLRIEDGRIAEITTFGAELFPAFGLPPTLA